MPGGPTAVGGGIGSSITHKNQAAGILMTGFAAFGGLLYGYDTGTIGGLQETTDWLRTFGQPQAGSPHGYIITASQTSLVVSILSVGTFFGALLGAPFGDYFGRKKALLFTNIVFCTGVAMQTGATQWALFNVGRVVAGLGVGLISTLIPMYQSECAPAWIRGAVVSCYQWAITIGLLLAAVLSQVCNARPNHSAYQIPIAIQFIWSLILTAGLFYLPESPRWLLRRGDDVKAAKALQRLTGVAADHPEVLQEIEDIKLSLRVEQELGSSSWADCFKMGPNKILLRTFAGMALQAWQQLTGVNFIFYYGTTFFTQSGIKNPFLTTIATNVVNVGMTVPGILAVDRVGRRKLLLIGAAGMCVCEYIVAALGLRLSADNQSGHKAIVAFVCIYIAFFASTWGPIAWVVIGEIFPLNIRAKGVALSAASNWLMNWAIAFATPYLVQSGPGNAGLGSKVFFIWGSTCLGCFIFTYFFIAETKGLTLEQVDILYQHSTPIKSNAYRRQLMAHNIHSADDANLDGIDREVGGGILGKRRTRDVEKGEALEHDSNEEKA